MEDLAEYDKAQAKFYGQLNIKAVPVMSWDFSFRFSDELKSAVTDFKKLKALAQNFNWNVDFDFAERLKEETVVVTDETLRIVFSSEKIMEMSGYLPEEVIGRSPKIFQGVDTDPAAINEIRIAIDKRKPFSTTMLNYKKNGTIYHCKIEAYPIFNLQNEFTHFIAFEKAA